MDSVTWAVRSRFSLGWRAWAVLAAACGLAAAAALTIVVLHNRADRLRQAEMPIARLEVSIDRMRGAPWSSLSPAGSAAAAAKEIAGASRDAAGDLATIERLEPSPQLRPLRETVQRFARELSGELALLRESRILEAVSMSAGTEARYHTTLDEIGAVRTATNRAAGRAGTVANIGSAIALALALLGFCVAFLRSARLRRQAERARLFGESLIESSVEGIVVLDRELRYRIWNRGMEQMTGMSRDEVVGREGLELFPFLPEGGTLRVWETALAGETVRLYDDPFEISQTGKVGFRDAVYSPLLDEAGEIAGVIAMVRDVTERHALEDELRRAQKMEATGQLAGGIAHEFNNLLTVVSGHAELARASLSSDPHDSSSSLDQIEQAVGRASALTRQLLALSRRQKLAPHLLDLNALVTESEQLLRPLLGEQIRVVTSLADELFPIKADPGQLSRVIINLAANARDAMPDGGTLVIATHSVELDEAGSARKFSVAPGSYTTLTVSDTGRGMDAETVAHIFEPFFTTKAVSKGAGLGLSTVQRIVRESGGVISVNTAPGHGSAFRILFPQAA